MFQTDVHIQIIFAEKRLGLTLIDQFSYEISVRNQYLDIRNSKIMKEDAFSINNMSYFLQLAYSR